MVLDFFNDIEIAEPHTSGREAIEKANQLVQSFLSWFRVLTPKRLIFFVYPSTSINLSPGSSLLFYTKGHHYKTYFSLVFSYLNVSLLEE